MTTKRSSKLTAKKKLRKPTNSAEGISKSSKSRQIPISESSRTSTLSLSKLGVGGIKSKIIAAVVVPLILLITIGLVRLITDKSNKFASVPVDSEGVGAIEIDAKQGAQVIFDDKVSLKIPIDGITSDSLLTFKAIEQKEMPKDNLNIMMPLGNVYEINIGDANLTGPASLELSFNSSDLPKDVSPENLFAAYFDDSNNQWVFAGGEVDTKNKVVRLETTHLSIWGLFTWNLDAWVAIVHKVMKVKWSFIVV